MPEPRNEAHPVTEAAAQRLEEMGVPVGQSGDDQLPGAVDDATRFLPEVTQVRTVAESDDAVSGDGHGVVFDDPALAVDGHHDAALDQQITFRCGSRMGLRLVRSLRRGSVFAHLVIIDHIYAAERAATLMGP